MTEGPDPTRRTPRLLLGAALAAAVLAGAGALALGSGSAVPTRVAASAPVPVPTAAVVGLAGGAVPWDQPLRLAVTDGTLRSVLVTDPDGAGVPGEASTTGWTSVRTLLPAATYTGSATVLDGNGAPHVLPLRVQTRPAERLLKASLSPGDDAVVGVGRPVAVTLSRDVEDPEARAAVLSRLVVSSTPAVPGAWRWMDDRTVHYRPAAFWPSGTKVSVRAELTRLALPDGTWGSGARTSTFTVGEQLISTVDVQAKTMTVRRDGKVLRVMRASMGRPEFPTRNGVFLVLEKHRTKVMDSATLALPPGEAAYRTKVDHAVRITNSGTFTHSAPWSVRDQGVRNVSHGCINLSPADAAWFYGIAQRGDVVRVVGSTVGPTAWDAGSRDWNMSFEEWQEA